MTSSRIDSAGIRTVVVPETQHLHRLTWHIFASTIDVHTQTHTIVHRKETPFSRIESSSLCASLPLAHTHGARGHGDLDFQAIQLHALRSALFQAVASTTVEDLLHADEQLDLDL